MKNFLKDLFKSKKEKEAEIIKASIEKQLEHKDAIYELVHPGKSAADADYKDIEHAVDRYNSITSYALGYMSAEQAGESVKSFVDDLKAARSAPKENNEQLTK